MEDCEVFDERTQEEKIADEVASRIVFIIIGLGVGLLISGLIVQYF